MPNNIVLGGAYYAGMSLFGNGGSIKGGKRRENRKNRKADRYVIMRSMT
jgi:hypothetical protein